MYLSGFYAAAYNLKRFCEVVASEKQLHRKN